jgi:hypothetical protein
MAAISGQTTIQATAPKDDDDVWLCTPEFAALIGRPPVRDGYFGDRCLKEHPESEIWSATREILRNLRIRLRAVGLEREAGAEQAWGIGNSLHHETYRLVIHSLTLAHRTTDSSDRMDLFCRAVRSFARLPMLDKKLVSHRNRQRAQKLRPPTARAAEMTPEALAAYARETGFTGKNVKTFYAKAASHFEAPEGRVRKTWTIVRANNLFS